MMSGIKDMPMNTFSKRLLEPDVNTIFYCFANNELPPENLNFRIIRIPQNGLKLSPPSFELEDGLYLLLRSDNDEPDPVPSALAGNVLTDSDLVSLPHCPWSLSGPQGAKRTGQEIFQRYCYPRGNSSYSNGKGGAMWTKVDMMGEENTSCRILQVYRSKRAGTDNSVKSKGVSSRKPKRKAKSVSYETRKKTKRAASGKELNGGKFQGSIFPSPCLSHLSINLGGKIDFDDDFLGIKGTPINLMPGAKKCTPIGPPMNQVLVANNKLSGNNAFSFIPVEEVRSAYGIENMMLNNPAFNSVVAKSSANFQKHYVANSGYNYGPHFQARYKPHPPCGGNTSCSEWAKADPPIPQPPTSNQTARVDSKGTGLLKVVDFSQKLKDLEESLLTDIRNSDKANQMVKLQVLQSWAKGVVNKPLQPQTDQLSVVTTQPNPNTQVAKSTQTNVSMQVSPKVESTGPISEVADVSTFAETFSNTLLGVKMESPDTSWITSESVI